MTKQEFYTQHGWKGSNYNSNLTTKDIAAIVKDYVKKAHSDYRFSITSDYYGISVTLMEHPVELTSFELMKEEVLNNVRRSSYTYIPSIDKAIDSELVTIEQINELTNLKIEEVGNHQLDCYNLEKNKWINPAIVEVLKDINNLVNSYNYDDSDSMIDYFDTNFYVDFNIGKSGKPAKLVARTAKKAA